MGLKALPSSQALSTRSPQNSRPSCLHMRCTRSCRPLAGSSRSGTTCMVTISRPQRGRRRTGCTGLCAVFGLGRPRFFALECCARLCTVSAHPGGSQTAARCPQRRHRARPRVSSAWILPVPDLGEGRNTNEMRKGGPRKPRIREDDATPSTPLTHPRLILATSSRHL